MSNRCWTTSNQTIRLMARAGIFFLGSEPMELMTMFYFLTTLVVVQILLELLSGLVGPVNYSLSSPAQSSLVWVPRIS
jgi:hypothetical protein